jgi:2-polyprenyl-6-methoxyphenol hydroxylase-like FAD-dependent oxidoreductase
MEVDDTPGADIIRATPRMLTPWPTHDFPSIPRWHRGRMVIIGDAAHAVSPSSGQGASMAIEDAVELARCLRDAPDVAEALTAYERLRRPRVEAVVKEGRRTSQTKAPNLVGRVMRDLMMRVLVSRVARGDPPSRWMWDHHIDWDVPALPSAGQRDAPRTA